MQWISICRELVLSFGVSSLTAQEFTSLGAGLRTASWQQWVPKDRSHGMSFTTLFPAGLRAQDTHVYLLHTWMFLCFHADTGVCVYIYMYVNISYVYTCIHICYIYINIVCLFVCLFIYLFIYCLQIDMICLCKL